MLLMSLPWAWAVRLATSLTGPSPDGQVNIMLMGNNREGTEFTEDRTQ